MAELNQKVPENGKKKIRSTKLAPKVDLTAMVDLAFLLITFFMLTTTLNKPAAMDIAMPDKSKDNTPPLLIDENRTATIILGEGKFMWYHGDFQKPIAFSEKPANLEKGLTSVIAQLKATISSMPGAKDMIVLIKPSKEARTKDVVLTIDLLKQQQISRYVIGKPHTDEEKHLLASIH
ncbi:biopolymer transporter ExbD [Sphingobacterium sp. InxBP1]|uniref:ExbD/TolR family protein n=1 Tax=Sphingobacterium sp. InxBP1 TaxID=2870328 RepID=UPI002243B1EB|nr:biopolymer transporter ExbD [Sphingobacterium sp. InxBP1]MCW8309694.1 biopolymer transporter ExbD [Sphingobacterium sp. InxBP1]